MPTRPSRLHPSNEGYAVYKHKLGFGIAHAMFITRAPGFMAIVTPESLWRELNSPRFTTPILRSWMPYIEAQLRTADRLEDAHCFNCHCGLLTATTKKLDEIVSNGLVTGHLHIQSEAELAEEAAA